MQVIYENIYHKKSKSFKIATYTYLSICCEISWHLHPEYEIVFIKNGKGTIQVESYSEEYEDGLLIFLGPNIAHMPFNNKQFKNNAEVVIQFTENLITEKLASFPEFKELLLLLENSRNCIVFSKKVHKKLTSSFLKFKHQNDTEQLLNLLDILYQLHTEKNQRTLLKKSYNLDVNKRSLDRTTKVFEHINKFYNTEIKSKDMADMLGLTPNSFCRLFKETTNRNFIEFLNEFRIRKSIEYFDNQDSTISEVMYHCGFNDPSYFSKQFKKFIGETPTAYLEKVSQMS